MVLPVGEVAVAEDDHRGQEQQGHREREDVCRRRPDEGPQRLGRAHRATLASPSADSGGGQGPLRFPPVPEAQRIVVVGGTGGLGSAVVGALLARGDRVLATGRDPDRLDALRRRGAAASPLDLGDPGCGEALATAAREELGPTLDGLALVAGRLEPIGPTRAVDLEALAATLDEHVLGALRVIQACAPLLDAATEPSLVLFSGGGATGPFPRYSAYALAKVATVRLAENLAAEEPGWRVNAVAPGFVATGMHETTLAADRDAVGPYFEETERRLREATPPEAAAGLVAFLLSPASTGISGRLVSAVWDPWREEGGARSFAARPTSAACGASTRSASTTRAEVPLPRPSPVLARRLGLAAAAGCALVALSLLLSFALYQNAWIEWGNAFWLVQRQEFSLRDLGHPSYFLQTNETGAFDPQFLFYGGSLFVLAGSLAIAFGSAWAAYVVILVLATASAFGGMLWLGRQAGLGAGLASLPALAVASSPYAATLLYGRGAWTEVVAISALPLALAGACAIVRRDRPWLGVAALAVAVAAVGGSHNITVVWGAVICGAILAVAAWAAGPERLRLVGPRRAALTAAGVVVGAALVAWSLLPAAAYGRTTRAYQAGPGLLDRLQDVDRLDVILRPYPYAPSPIAELSPANHYQLPIYVLAWAAAASAVLIAGRRARRTDRRLAIGLWALLGALLVLLVANPVWDHLPGLLTAIQFPLRLHAYAALVTGLLALVGLRMLRGHPRRAAWVGALVAALAVQVGMAQYTAWSAPSYFRHENVVLGAFPAGFDKYQRTMYRRVDTEPVPRPRTGVGLAGLTQARLVADPPAPRAPRYASRVVDSEVVACGRPGRSRGATAPGSSSCARRRPATTPRSSSSPPPLAGRRGDRPLARGPRGRGRSARSC